MENKLIKIIDKLPNSPGVYFFIGNKNTILYIGKATDLKSRVKSYFANNLAEARGFKISKMIQLVSNIKFQKTDSVLEALILENYLIKKHQPKYNTKEKDDKSYNFVIITKENFPRILLLRSRDILNKKMKNEIMDFKIEESFGPFPIGSSIKEALKIIRKIFPFRDKCIPFNQISNKNIKPCFNKQLGLCPGVCVGEIEKKEYQKTIKNIIRFFKGQKKDILKDLNKQMKDFVKEMKFEEANKIKKQIFSINHIQDVFLIKNNWNEFLNTESNSEDLFRIESYDISHTSGQNVVGVMVVVENGEINKNEYRKFNIKDNPNNNDLKSLKEVLSRRLLHKEWRFPNLIVVDGGENQKKLFEKIMGENNLKIPVVSVVKDGKHNPREILGGNQFLKYKRDILLSNFEAHRFAISFHRKLRNI